MAFAMLGALAWQARPEQAIPDEPFPFIVRGTFPRFDSSVHRPRLEAEVRPSPANVSYGRLSALAIHVSIRAMPFEVEVRPGRNMSSARDQGVIRPT